MTCASLSRLAQILPRATARVRVILPGLLASGWLVACATPDPGWPAAAHLVAKEAQGAPAGLPPALPKPVASRPPPATYSIAVQDQPVQTLLLGLAREAGLNLDIHPEVSGRITLNAVRQSVPQLMRRIARQADLRYELDGNDLSVMPDQPFLRQYKVDYVNLSRQSSAVVASSTQIATVNPSTTISQTPPALTGGNNLSSARIENSAKNLFWESLERNIKDILRETDRLLPDGSSETQIEQTANQQAVVPATPAWGARGRHGVPPTTPAAGAPQPLSSQSSGNAVVRRNTFREAASVIVNGEGGVIAVRASQRQHDRVREFIDQVVQAARRQVLIEATIVEVSLRNAYEQGIDWRQLSAGGLVEFIGNPLRTGVNLRYTRNDRPNALISLLETFGTTRVLSSPRLSVLNNQTALLKVVENYVYFSVKADAVTTANVGTTTTYTTTPQTVPVGLVMGVTPQIGESDEIILNVRPTITSIGREVPDPNPDLRKNGIENLVPVIRTREIDSVMRIADGDVAILGGLMEDGSDQQNRRVPGMGEIPLFGELFNNRHNQRRKTELVVFLRPVIIRDSSLEGDYAGLRDMLPAPGLPPLRPGLHRDPGPAG